MELDILAFGAHPDDVELFAGGTLAKMAALGHSTGIVDMTRGEFGTRGTPEIRAQEAEEAARVLGLTVRENLELPDGHVEVNPAARLKVIRVLRKYRPPLVLVHHWRDNHPDHVHTSRLVAEAAHHAGLGKVDTGQDRFRPQTLVYFKLPPDATPNLIVDVSQFAERRAAAIRAYRSQLFDAASTEPSTYLSQPDFVTEVENLHSYYGNLIGTRKGEGFYVQEPFEIPDLVDFFKKQSRRRLR